MIFFRIVDDKLYSAGEVEKLGFEDEGKEDFGQTLGVWGADSGCYFVLPILGPTTARDAIGLVGNTILDPVYQITHNTEIRNDVIGNGNYSEHNYYYYRGTGAVDSSSLSSRASSLVTHPEYEFVQR